MIYAFADFIVDSDRRELRRSKAVVHAEPQVFDLLVLLVDNHHRVLSKDELIEKIANQSDEQSGHHDIRELERIRDRNVAAMLLALERNDWGAGTTIAEMRARRDQVSDQR